MVQHTATKRLPTKIAAKLRSIRRRDDLLALLRAVLIGVAALLVVMVLAMAFDWAFTLFDTRFRVALTSLALLTAAVTLIVLAATALWRSHRLLRAAESADAQVPQLQERWRTVASFAGTEHRPTNGTSRLMLEQVTSEAIALEQLVEPSRVVRPESLRPAFFATAASLLLFAGFLGINWDRTSVLLRRFWSPTAPITATLVRLLDGDRQLPHGELLELQGRLSGIIPDTAVLTVVYNSGVQDNFELTPDERSICAQSLRAENSFRYQLQAGDARSDWNKVTVLRYPGIAELQLTVTAPEYVNRPVIEKSLLPSRLKVIEGSYLSLRLKPQAALARCELKLVTTAEDSEPRPTSLLLYPVSDGWYEYSAQLVEDVSLSPVLTSPDGLLNDDRAVCRIHVLADQAPVARVISPTDEVAVATDDVIDIKFEAHDDHGIATVELVVYDESNAIEGSEPQILSVEQIPLDDQLLKKHIMGEVQLDLKKLNLPAGTSISYAIRVTDNRDLMVRPELAAGQSAQMPPEEGDEESLARNDPRQHSSPRPGSADTGDSPTANNRPPADSDADSTELAMLDPSRTGGATAATPAASREDTASNRRTATDAAPADSDHAPDDSDSPAESAPRGESGTQPSDAGDLVAQALTASTPSPARPRTGTAPSPTDVANPENPAESPNPESPTGTPQYGSNETASGAATAQSSSSGDAPVEMPPEGEAPQNPSVSDAASPVANRPGEPSSAGQQTAPQAASQPVARQGGGNQTPASQNANNPPSDANQSKQPRENQSPRSSIGIARKGQQSESGQNTESQRRRLKIAARLASVAESIALEQFNNSIRDQVVAIDTMLAEVEAGLQRLVQRLIPDAERSTQFSQLDRQLGGTETFVANLREKTAETEYTFVGLQMVDVAQRHITPARDLVFVGIREPLSTASESTEAYHHILRARELLAALLKRYDRVAQERKFQREIDESVTMYEVYVEKMQQLLREARQNRSPLERKMAVFEVDQAYLDRLAEVQGLRRDLRQEFARMLGNDPRLRSRYLDIIRRSRRSIRDQLGELSERQEEIATELNGWRSVDETQRPDVWMLVTELRLQTAAELAKDAALLDEHMQQQFPLILDKSRGSPQRVWQLSSLIDGQARQLSLDARRIMHSGGDIERGAEFVTHARDLLDNFDELQAALDQLLFDYEADEEVAAYVPARQLEARAVMNAADDWLQIATAVRDQRYAGLAWIDQQKLAIATDLLRGDMLDLETDIEGQFSLIEVDTVPGHILDLIRELQGLMEQVVFHQQAATFALNGDQLPSAEVQQGMAVDKLQLAKDIFDKLRKSLVAALDEYDPPDPSIANLVDPLLDEFLAQLEREPNLEAQLGLPNRPSNIRMVQDMVTQTQNGAVALGESSEAAMQRARRMMEREEMQQQAGRTKPDEELTDEERRRREQQRDTGEMLEQSLLAVKEKQADPQTTPEQRKQLDQLRRRLEQLQQVLGQRTEEAEEWQRRTEGDEAAAILAALAQNRQLPDQQWNKLLSTLDDGLWQVDGRVPPEAYRNAIEQYQDHLRKLTQ